jgi:ribosomal protein RSM22 (predicted rRNA methylase)
VLLPQPVRRAIEERADAAGFAVVKRAAAALSAGYREGQAARLTSAERTVGYLVTRMPATYAAAHAVLCELRQRLGGATLASVLDIGAGTGAASLAARECFPEARAFTMVERDPGLAAAAREWLPGARLVMDDVTRMATLPRHDLVIAAYALGELSAPAAAMLWQAARVALVVIEPGTPRGASLIRRIREQLLAAGAHMAAPCPCAMPCPLVEPDWCHFAARVERSSLHRRIKDAELNYEDEKFSYVALVREPVPLPGARILRRPRHYPGLVALETCTPTGLRSLRIAKRDGNAFRMARKAGWGGAVE